MRYLHAMIRVMDLEKSLHFYRDLLGLKVTRQKDFPEGKFSLIYLATDSDAPEIELTHNWEQTESYSQGKNFGHFAFEVEDIYQTCQMLSENGVEILRPPRDGRMAFVKCPDGISIEFLQKGDSLEVQEPWKSMQNIGTW